MYAMAYGYRAYILLICHALLMLLQHLVDVNVATLTQLLLNKCLDCMWTCMALPAYYA